MSSDFLYPPKNQQPRLEGLFENIVKMTNPTTTTKAVCTPRCICHRRKSTSLARQVVAMLENRCDDENLNEKSRKEKKTWRSWCSSTISGIYVNTAFITCNPKIVNSYIMCICAHLPRSLLVVYQTVSNSGWCDTNRFTIKAPTSDLLTKIFLFQPKK